MEGRRYPEGVSNIPSLALPDHSKKSPAETIHDKRRNFYIVPTSITGMLSTTSAAKECFVNRKPSKLFQQFMVNYAYTVVTSRVLSGEI